MLCTFNLQKSKESLWGQILYYNITYEKLFLWPVFYGLNIPEPFTT
jgi:hypothetical protein